MISRHMKPEIGKMMRQSSMKFSFVLFLLIIALYPVSSSGQTASLQIEDQLSCSGDVVHFYLIPSQLDSLGALTIYVDYSTSSLIFDTLSLINSAFSGLIYNDIQDQNGNPIGKVGISWSGVSPVNAGSNAFVQLSFIYLGVPDTLRINPDSEIADWEANVLNVSYLSGVIDNAYEPVIISEPDSEILAYGNIMLEIVANPADSFQWQYLDGDSWIDMEDGALVGGSDNSQLYLFVGALGGLDRYVRCLVSACATVSSSVFQIQWMIASPEFIPASQEYFHYDLVNQRLIIQIPAMSSAESYQFEIISMDARSLRKIHLSQSLEISLNDFPAGVYLLQLAKSNHQEWIIRKKIVISH